MTDEKLDQASEGDDALSAEGDLESADEETLDSLKGGVTPPGTRRLQLTDRNLLSSGSPPQVKLSGKPL